MVRPSAAAAGMPVTRSIHSFQRMICRPESTTMMPASTTSRTPRAIWRVSGTTASLIFILGGERRQEVADQRPQRLQRWKIHHERQIAADLLLTDLEIDVEKQDEIIFDGRRLEQLAAVAAHHTRQRHREHALEHVG